MTNIVFSDNLTTQVFYHASTAANGTRRLLKAPFNVVRIGGVQYIEPDNLSGLGETANDGLAASDFRTEIEQLGRGGSYVDGFIYLEDAHGSGDGDGMFDQFALGWI